MPNSFIENLPIVLEIGLIALGHIFPKTHVISTKRVQQPTGLVDTVLVETTVLVAEKPC